MAKRDDQQRGNFTQAVGGVVSAPQAMREWLNRVFLPFAWVIGWAGTLALMACGALYAGQDEFWPEQLWFGPSELPRIAMISSVAASLLGWGCMQQGLARIREGLGWRLGGWVLILLPTVCVALEVMVQRDMLELGEWVDPRYVPEPWLRTFIRWFPAAVVIGSILAFLDEKVRTKDAIYLGKGVWYAWLVTPYVLLLGGLAFHLRHPWMDAQLQETAEVMGFGVLGLQILLVYFIGGAAR